MPGAEDAARRRQRGVDGEDRLGDIHGGGGAADLVGDHAERLTLDGEAHHRLQEIGAVNAVDPGGAQDRVSRVGGAHRGLAVGLGATVDAERCDRIVLGVGAAPAAVEDVIGREMEDGHAGCRRVASASTRGPATLPRCGGVRLALGPVDGGKTGAIDHQARPPRGDHGGRGAGIGDVDLGARHAECRHAASGGERHQLPPDLPGGAEDEDRPRPRCFVVRHDALTAPSRAAPSRSPR